MTGRPARSTALRAITANGPPRPARAGGAFFVDLNEIIAKHYDAIGQEKVTKEFFVSEHTHTSLAGAKLNAQCVIEGIQGTQGLPIDRLCDTGHSKALTTTEATNTAPAPGGADCQSAVLFRHGGNLPHVSPPPLPIFKEPPMKRLLVFALVLCCSVSAKAALTLQEVRTASNNVLVAYFKSTVIKADEVKTADLSAWKLNGQPVAAINKFVTEADACDHHIYLQVPTLVNGTTYTLQTPHGDTTFVFDDHKIFCESIKTNQNAYRALGKVRYANFDIWLGDGGTEPISGSLPEYSVFRLSDGQTIAQGSCNRLARTKTRRRAITSTASIWPMCPKAGSTRLP